MRAPHVEVSHLIQKKFAHSQKPTHKRMETSKAVKVAPKAAPTSTKKMGC